jgi:hypothetical protein
VVLRVSMSGFIIPYLGLGAELSPDTTSARAWWRSRSIFGMAGTLAAFVLGFAVFLSGPKGLLDRAGTARSAGPPARCCCLRVRSRPGLVAQRAAHAGRHADRHALGPRLLEELRDTVPQPVVPPAVRRRAGVLRRLRHRADARAQRQQVLLGLEVAQIKSIALAMVGGMALGCRSRSG